MKKNSVRLEKLEERLVGSKSDLFRLSDFEILERIQELEFQRGMRPTHKFMDMKKVTDKTKKIFTPKVSQLMREKQAEKHAQIEAMNDVELDNHLDRLVIECGIEGTFEKTIKT
jgi:hypothetical protein